MKVPTSGVAALAALTALPSLLNGFVYDDVLVIVENPLVHGLARSGEIWHSSYWPAGGLFRPLTLQLFALEWTAGGGRPALFHAVSVVLAALTAVLVYRLALRMIPPIAAVAAATLFAVHPVHVEVVANIVGQSELLVAVFGLLAVERYLAWRAEGELSARRRWALAALVLLAISAKETGYVLPILLAAAELVLVPKAPNGRKRFRIVVSVFVLQAGVAVSALLLRMIVLGSLAGDSPAPPLAGLDGFHRAVAMLAVVPVWTRLLLWPVHLQAEYGPPALPVASALGPAQLLGLGIVAAAAAGTVWAWRRDRTLVFGLLWIAVSLGPVSNLLLPTGVLVAERVLFLPSVGLALAAGAGMTALANRSAATTKARRAVERALGFAVLALLAARSIVREAVWRSQPEFFSHLVNDAPRVYRAHLVASRYYYGARRYPEAEREAGTALALYDGDVHVHEQLGQVLRTEGRCAEAVPILAAGVRIAPEGTTVRSRLVECLLATGDTVNARSTAEEAVRLGQPEFRSTVERLTRPAKIPPQSR